MTSISDNFQQVHQRMGAACDAAQRPRSEVHLLAVSKTFDAQAIREAYAAGQIAFGENYIQEAVEKMSALADLPLQWHCIGPVQSNKTSWVAQHFDWVHTVDRLKIAQRLSEQRSPARAPLQVCVQVNIDGGASKSGLRAEALADFLQSIALLPHLCVRGLMSIPEPSDDFAVQRNVHAKTYALFKSMQELQLKGLAQFDTLSMGMSSDLEAAILEGSNMVRVGSAIFGHRDKP